MAPLRARTGPSRGARTAEGPLAMTRRTLASWLDLGSPSVLAWATCARMVSSSAGVLMSKSMTLPGSRSGSGPTSSATAHGPLGRVLGDVNVGLVDGEDGGVGR